MAPRDSSVLGYRFGPFEVDVVTGELRKAGIRIKLQDQPLQVLVYLLERADQLVTREELIKQLWPGDTFVDFDNSLNTAVNKLRAALSDTAEEARYIETLPRKGYRFVAPVDLIRARPRPAAPILAEPETAILPAPGPAGAAAPVAAPGRLAVGIASASALVLLLALLVFLPSRWSPPSPPPADSPSGQRPRLVVLPFQNLSTVDQQDYLSEGVTEEITSQLARLDPGKLGVIARTSAERYARASQSVSEIAKALGADYVIEGSVQRSRDAVRIHVQLIRSADQTHMWVETFDRPASAWMSVQADVARRVARALAIELLPGQRAALERASTTNAAAYDAYLQGRHALNHKRPDSLERAEQHLLRAVALDPNYALALATLADTYSFRSGTSTPQQREYARKAESTARKALEIDPLLGEAHSALAQLAFSRWQWNKAEENLLRALQLNGNDGRALQMYVKYLQMNGRFSEALPYARRAVELDPQAGANGWYGWTLLHAGNYREAQTEAEKLLAAGRKQSQVDGHWMLGSSLLGQGRVDAAVAELEKAHKMNNQIASLWVDLASAYWRTGQRERALTIARDLETSGERFAFLVATLYARFGMADQTVTHLERAFRARNLSVMGVNFRKEFSQFRNDPRFQVLQKKVGEMMRSNN